MKKIIALFLFTILINSCKQEAQPLVFSEINFTSEEQAIIEVNIPKVETNSAIGKKINATIEGFTAFNISLQEETMEDISIAEAIKQFNREYQSFTEKFSEPSQPWEAFVDGEVTYQSPEIISIALNTYLNTGGAHGNSVISFLNFNPSTGTLYKNTELISDSISFTALAEEHFNKNRKEKDTGFTPENDFKLPEAIGFNDDGVIILFNTYEIESYEKGMLEFTIPYDEANPFLTIN